VTSLQFKVRISESTATGTQDDMAVSELHIPRSTNGDRIEIISWKKNIIIKTIITTIK
jgi:hypothetical protein